MDLRNAKVYELSFMDAENRDRMELNKVDENAGTHKSGSL
jgi:hypothetical protein